MGRPSVTAVLPTPRLPDAGGRPGGLGAHEQSTAHADSYRALLPDGPSPCSVDGVGGRGTQRRTRRARPVASETPPALTSASGLTLAGPGATWLVDPGAGGRRTRPRTDTRARMAGKIAPRSRSGPRPPELTDRPLPPPAGSSSVVSGVPTPPSAGPRHDPPHPETPSPPANGGCGLRRRMVPGCLGVRRHRPKVCTVHGCLHGDPTPTPLRSGRPCGRRRGSSVVTVSFDQADPFLEHAGRRLLLVQRTSCSRTRPSGRGRVALASVIGSRSRAYLLRCTGTVVDGGGGDLAAHPASRRRPRSSSERVIASSPPAEAGLTVSCPTWTLGRARSARTAAPPAGGPCPGPARVPL